MSCHPNYLAFWSFGRDHLLHLTSDEEEEEEVYDDLVIDDQIKCKNCSDNKNLDENIQQIIGVFGQGRKGFFGGFDHANRLSWTDGELRLQREHSRYSSGRGSVAGSIPVTGYP